MLDLPHPLCTDNIDEDQSMFRYPKNYADTDVPLLQTPPKESKGQKRYSVVIALLYKKPLTKSPVLIFTQ